MIDTWQDKDKRRAALLSLFLHLAVLLSLVWVWSRPEPVPLDTFLVIDVGTPEQSDTVTDAPTADDPAPQAAEPQVATSEAGEPTAAAPPEPEALEQDQEDQAAAEPEATQEAEPPSEPAESEPVAESPEPEPAPPPTQAETPPPPAEAAEPEADPSSDNTTAAALPNVDEVELESDPLPIPRPTPNVEVSPARPIAATPTAQVTPEEAVPQPEASATLAEAITLPQPEALAEVTPPEALPTPEASVEVAQAAPVPQPQVEAAVTEARDVQPQASAEVTPAQTVPQPEASAETTEVQAVPQPQAEASVAEARDVQPQASASVTQAQPVPNPQAEASVAQARDVQPQASASVTTATAVPQPSATASATPARTVPQPAATASAAPSRGVAITPQAQVSAAREVPTPQASVGQVAGATEAGTVGPQTNSTPGGNAERSGQTTTAEDAAAEGQGAATSPDGSATPSGAPLVQIPYEENRLQPLAVIIDNVNGYPQAGLAEASLIAEMPVEGGLTRLMTVYDRADPTTVGPVRSARDYFLELALNLNGVLVHDGGSPTALAAIANSEFPTLNANAAGGSELFQRAGERTAPYNLYSTGSSLRQAVNTLDLGSPGVVSGTTYLPAEDAESSVSTEVAYSGGYSSAFRFINDLNQYRWVRAGEDAVDASGEGVYVDAVVVAEVEARLIPDDLEGRLYMSLRNGGRATLYLRGKAIPGRWEPDGGVSFFTSLGDPIDLTPFKTWVMFAPSSAQVVEQ